MEINIEYCDRHILSQITVTVIKLSITKLTSTTLYAYTEDRATVNTVSENTLASVGAVTLIHLLNVAL